MKLETVMRWKKLYYISEWKIVFRQVINIKSSIITCLSIHAQTVVTVWPDAEYDDNHDAWLRGIIK